MPVLSTEFFRQARNFHEKRRFSGGRFVKGKFHAPLTRARKNFPQKDSKKWMPTFILF
jgi:hypothetical protein